MRKTGVKFAPTLLAMALIIPTAASAQAEDSWQFSVRVNGWFPNVSGETAQGDDFEIELEDLIDDLKFAMIGSIEARKGRWGLFSDVFYSDIGGGDDNYHQGTLGGTEIPVDLNISAEIDVKSEAWTTAGFYRVIEDSGMTLDILAGFRYMEVDQELNWRIHGDIDEVELPGREGTLEADFEAWDAIVGVRGRIPLGQGTPWFIPYYVDVGAGDSDFTWQGSTGIGYGMGRWGLGLTWRYLSYDLASGGEIADIEFSGPAAVFEYTW
jgi:hypothetical protein